MQKKIKQIFHHYETCEDFQNGMYLSDNNIDLIPLAMKVLSDKILCYNSMLKVITQWPISTEHNLTNLECNRRAWLGQAACCIEYKVPEHLTRIAWNHLNKKNQDEANRIAEQIINMWEINYLRKTKNCAQATFNF